MYDIKFCSHTKDKFRRELTAIQPILRAERKKKQDDENARQAVIAKEKAIALIAATGLAAAGL